MTYGNNCNMAVAVKFCVPRENLIRLLRLQCAYLVVRGLKTTQEIKNDYVLILTSNEIFM